jgi:hypothetical protein
MTRANNRLPLQGAAVGANGYLPPGVYCVNQHNPMSVVGDRDNFLPEAIADLVFGHIEVVVHL